MSYSVCAYLTEADKVKPVYGARDNLLLNQLKAALKPGVDSLNDYFSDSLNTDMDAYAVLADIVNGEVRYPDDFPYIISIPVSELESKRMEYNSLEEGNGIGDYDYEQEMDDLNFIFDEAVEAQKDLVIMVY